MASLTTWKPMRGLFETHKEMDRIFDSFFRRGTVFDRLTHSNWLPPVDVLDTEDYVEIRAEVPGLSEKDVHVSIADDVLTLKGEKKHESEEKDGNYHRLERSYGHFQRSFALPKNLEAEQVKAMFKNGVLTISIPKTEQSKPKEIPISTE